jgi:heterodisulfide reductase subunit D
MTDKTDISHTNEELYICAKCGYCRDYCPARRFKGFETYSARGKILNLKRLLERHEPLTKDVVENCYMCAVCGYCKEMCPTEIDLPELFVNIRADLVKKGLGPLPAHLRITQGIKEKHNPYSEPHEKRTAWLPEKLPQKAEVIYFVGCTPSYRTQKTAESVFRLLKKANVNFTVMPEEGCCGSPLLMTGQLDAAKTAIEHNTALMEGAKTLITGCSGCYRMWKIGYEKVTGKKPPFEVFHATEYLQFLLDEKKLKPTKEIRKKVTYHDPCHLGRHLGIFEPPRAILKSIPGVTLVEMERVKNLSMCCGAGAGVMTAFPDMARFAASERIKEAEAAGAEILASACPFCELNLSRTAEATGAKLQVTDITELLALSLGLT